MSLALVARRNAQRKKARLVLTIAAVAITFCGFVLLRTVVRTVSRVMHSAAEDRLIVMHRAGHRTPIPLTHARLVGNVPGVQVVTYATQLGYDAPAHGRVVAGVAMKPDRLLKVMDEVRVEPEVFDKWINTRSGALVGDELAEDLGLRTGDSLTLVSRDIELHLTVEGVYRVDGASGGTTRTSVYFNYELLNQQLPEEQRNRAGVILFRPEAGADPRVVASRVEEALAGKGIPVVVRSERAQILAVLSRFSSVLTAIDFALGGIVLLMLLIVANTMAMGVNERTREFAVLRSVGFTKRHIITLIGVEAVIVGGVAAVVGLAVAYPLVVIWIPQWIQVNTGASIAYWDPGLTTYVMGLGVVLITSLLAAALPAWRVASLPVTTALRHTG